VVIIQYKLVGIIIMIDRDGYRLNVGIIIANKEGKLFWGKRTKSQGWQFPQGGMNPYETLEETMYRELGEEVGLTTKDVQILAITKRWVHYDLPIKMRRQVETNYCIGQRQKWFLLLLTGPDDRICLTTAKKPEFSKWHWIEYWEPMEYVVYFKRAVYRRVLAEFEKCATRIKNNNNLII
jgi:putative (di)nucleoside polyphosphate hydrolase